MIWGSLAVMRSLLHAGEVDELDLFGAPIALGAGTALVAPGGPYRLQGASTLIEHCGGSGTAVPPGTLQGEARRRVAAASELPTTLIRTT